MMKQVNRITKEPHRPFHPTQRSACCKRSVITCRSRSPDQNQETLPSATLHQLYTNQAILMASASAVLGPLCDNLHSQYHVLTYRHPSISIPDVFETTWWTPILFGTAGIILGIGVPLLDQVFSSSSPLPSPPSSSPQPPSWFLVHLCISAFVLQYFLSALLDSSNSPYIDTILGATALSTWLFFDRSPAGLCMSLLTAVCGPAIEVVLISKFHLYEYTHADVFDCIPHWIGFTYFAGGPAVGNLGRRTLADLMLMHKVDERAVLR